MVMPFIGLHWDELLRVFLWCYYSYWVLVLLLCRAWCFDMHGFVHGFLVPALAIHVSAWKGLCVIIAFFGWFWLVSISCLCIVDFFGWSLIGCNSTYLHGCFLWLVLHCVHLWLQPLKCFIFCLSLLRALLIGRFHLSSFICLWSLSTWGYPSGDLMCNNPAF